MDRAQDASIGPLHGLMDSQPISAGHAAAWFVLRTASCAGHATDNSAIGLAMSPARMSEFVALRAALCAAEKSADRGLNTDLATKPSFTGPSATDWRILGSCRPSIEPSAVASIDLSRLETGWTSRRS